MGLPNYPISVIGVDPGGTTGACVLLLSRDAYKLESVHQFKDDATAWQDVQGLVTRCHESGYEVHLVIEQFDKRPGIINPDYSAKYVERDIDNNVSGYDVKKKQIPAEAKNFIKEARRSNGKGDGLKRFGFYQTAFKHANDSLRHAVTYSVVRLKHRPLILKGWPKQ